MTNPCPHARSAAEFITSRAVMGRKKYGHTLADANLSSAELVQHAREETADLLVYLTALKESMAKPEPARPAVTRRPHNTKRPKPRQGALGPDTPP
jgi:hypothetical protein